MAVLSEQSWRRPGLRKLPSALHGQWQVSTSVAPTIAPLKYCSVCRDHPYAPANLVFALPPSISHIATVSSEATVAEARAEARTVAVADVATEHQALKARVAELESALTAKQTESKR